MARYRRSSWKYILCVQLGQMLLGGWLFMLAVGVVHHEWIEQCPTIGFGWAVLLGFLLRGSLYLNDNAGED